MGDPDHSALDGTFDGLYGLRVLSADAEEARAEVAVRDELRQPAGLVHGGVLCSMAEALASMATFLAVAPEGKVAMGLSNSTSFLRPITTGTIHATARGAAAGRWRGSSQW